MTLTIPRNFRKKRKKKEKKKGLVKRDEKNKQIIGRRHCKRRSRRENENIKCMEYERVPCTIIGFIEVVFHSFNSSVSS